MNTPREISPDEGYRQNEPIRAFYTHALPCESCGNPVETRKPAEWDPALQVGPCCEFSLNLMPDIPVCDNLWPALERCQSVQDVELAMEAHRLCCGFCRGERRAA
jgi:hypothetical protein